MRKSDLKLEKSWAAKRKELKMSKSAKFRPFPANFCFFNFYATQIGRFGGIWATLESH